jgi:DedD protein
MARNVSDEELQLKKRARRRLVGAIVLVTAVAVVLPMVLDSEPRPVNQNIDIQIPSPDAGVLSSSATPLKPADPSAVAVAKTASAPEAVSAPVAAAKPAILAEAKPETKSGADVKPPETKTAANTEAGVEPKAVQKAENPPPAKPLTQAEPKTQKAATAPPAKAKDSKEKPKAAGGFVIQVAALSDTAKAKELQAKIAGSGMKAYTEVVQTAKGPVTRVRVGPYSSREAAEKARPQLQKLQLDGKVVPR